MIYGEDLNCNSFRGIGNFNLMEGNNNLKDITFLEEQSFVYNIL